MLHRMIEALSSPDIWLSFATLTALEIVLGVDNIIFIAILVSRLPPENREKVRKLGIAIALISRLGLLFALSWLMGLTEPLFAVFGKGFSGRDLILLVGGLFLIGKATHEMHAKLEGGAEEPTEAQKKKMAANAMLLLAQIAVVDIVFSLDSVITAIGMADRIWIMVVAMLLSVAVMLAFAKSIGDFVDRHPTVKILALSFLILIGVMLVAEGLGQHISKGYVYFAMAYALVVELNNIRRRRRAGAAAGRASPPSSA